MLRALRRADYRFVALALGVYLISTIFWSTRWKVALSAVGHRVKLWSLYLVIYGSIFINNITPLTRAGGDPLGRAYLLKKTARVPYSSGFASIVGEYILDAPVFFSILAAGLLIYFGWGSVGPILAVVGIWLALLTLVGPGASRVLKRRVAARKVGELITRVLRFLRRRAKHAEVVSGVNRFYRGAYQVVGKWRSALLMVCMSAALWSLDMLRLSLIFRALGWQASVNMLLLASTLPTIAGWVPLLPGGLGLVDATLVSVFLLFGLPAQLALAATLIERAISYVFSTAVGATTLSYLGLRIWR